MTDRIDELRIEPIAKHHIRKAFSCRKPARAEYLQRHARQNDEKNIAKSFVAVDESDAVLGYYSISAFSIEYKELPKDISRSMPGYPVPAALLGKLAVDASTEGQGLGTRLLIDALQRIVTASQELAVKAVIVDAIDDEAKAFYLKFGFIELPGHRLKLFLPIETIKALL